MSHTTQNLIISSNMCKHGTKECPVYIDIYIYICTHVSSSMLLHYLLGGSIDCDQVMA